MSFYYFSLLISTDWCWCKYRLPGNSLYSAADSDRQFSYLVDFCECVTQTNVMHAVMTDNTAMAKILMFPLFGKKNISFLVFFRVLKSAHFMLLCDLLDLNDF